VLLWYEHSPNNAEDDPKYALAAAGLKGLKEARLSAIRSATGFVVRANRPEADGLVANAEYGQRNAIGNNVSS
jgi:hypothetical protein